MIKYSLVQRKNPLEKEAPLKVHATAQANAVLQMSDIAQHIARHGCVYGRADIEAVISKVADCVREQLLAGNQVVLGDLGKFELSLKCEGADAADKFNPDANIKDVQVRWRPSKMLKNLREDAHFQESMTREDEKNALAEQKNG